MLGSRLKLLKSVLTTMVLIATISGRLSAQSTVYPNSYPSYSNSYPSLSSGQPTFTTSQPTYPSVQPTYASSQPAYATSQPTNSSTSLGLTRIQSAQHSAEQFRKIAQSASPVVAKVANQNADFAQQWVLLAQTHEVLAQRVSDARAKLAGTTRDLEEVSNKLSQYGMTPTVGLLLQHKKEQLSVWQATDSTSLFSTEELGRWRAKQLELEMVRFDGAETARQTAEILAEAGLDSTSFQYSSLVTKIQELLYQRSRWLAALKQGYQDYQQSLSELDSITTASTKLTADFRTLIAQNIIWIRSGSPLDLDDFQKSPRGLAAIFDSQRSGEIGFTLKRKWDADPASGIGLIAWILLIGIVRWRAVTWLVGIGSRRRLKDATEGTRKLAASVLTPLIAAAFPGTLYLIARWLGAGIVSESTLQSSSGFYAASLVALLVEVPRQLLRGNGFVDRHLEIKLPRRQRASAYLTLIGFGLVLAAYVITVTSLVDHGLWRESTARIEFIIALFLVAWTFHLALRPTGGFLEPFIAKFGGSVIHRLRFVIYIFGVGFPLAMVVLSALGYGFTANVIITRAITTLVCLLIAMTLWSAVKIVSGRVWQMLTGTATPRQFDEYGEIKVEPTLGVLAEHYLELKHHLAFLCQCALVLAAIVCFGWLWIDVFPNVRMGNPVVWSVQDTITESTVDAAGNPLSRSVVAQTPVTVLHLLLAAATMFVAFQLAKLLPALFDALVLQRVSFDEGMEHFSLVLGRFLLFGVGCLVACTWIGIRWQTIQWLAVGLTIGLGFGLQDMVRNLFGGFVVLFEKPARLGDLITVGRVTGRVAAQRFRCTVLSDDEGREVIVPNKNFVCEEVVNWMGAGRLQAISIEVAVKRDVRPADICRTLQELVIDQPDVLLAPGPQATLVCVGKSSQRIEVRAWIEEGQDASRFRDSMLHLVSKYLRERELLSSAQPSQPLLRDVGIDSPKRSFNTATGRSRKRSA